jgi:putative intracellular protease/amidase
MLILVGSDLWANGSHAAFASLTDRFLAAGATVAAICGATFGLAQAGILDRYDHTSNAAMYLAMSGYQASGRYRDEPAVTDRNLITASGTAPMDFARHIFVALDLYEPHVLDAWYRLYHDQDASAFAVLAAA